MGTYTTNKNLFMPSVGETGWGTLVNGNFETIDNFLKPITVSGSTYTFTGNQTGGSISATSITNSGTLTNTGKITANGGIETTILTASSTSTFTGKITANGGIGTTSLTTSSTITSTGKITGNGGIAGTTGTFSGAVTGASFNGIVLKSSGSITVTPISGSFILPKASSDAFFTGMLTILPPVSNAVYSGSLTLTPSGSSASLMYFDGSSAERKTKSISSTTTFSFSNIPFLIAHSNPQISVSKFKLS